MDLLFPPLYVILDAPWLKTSAALFLPAMAHAGVTLIQYRDKSADARRLFAISSELAQISASCAASRSASDPPRLLHFILNDRPDVAHLTGAAGVHVGQHDVGVEEARAIVGPQRWVGISTHTLEQLAAADRTSADYIAFGPIFPTITKMHPDPVVGLEGLAAARRHTRKPLVAIGGITLERAQELYAAGADSLAVARDILAAEDPPARARAYLETAARTALPNRPAPPKSDGAA